MVERGIGGEPLVKVKLYIEGGGKGEEQTTEFRQGWQAFFRECGLRRLPAVVRGESRERTWDRFQTAVKQAKNGELPVLLVDSESAVVPGDSVWQHLAKEDRWQQPEGVGEEQAFLMVRYMETWLVAGLGAEKHWPNLESVEKDKILLALAKVTGNRYAKGQFAILGNMDPQQLQERCPSAKRLLEWLRKL